MRRPTEPLPTDGHYLQFMLVVHQIANRCPPAPLRRRRRRRRRRSEWARRRTLSEHRPAGHNHSMARQRFKSHFRSRVSTFVPVPRGPSPKPPPPMSISQDPFRPFLLLATVDWRAANPSLMALSSDERLASSTVRRPGLPHQRPQA